MKSKERQGGKDTRGVVAESTNGTGSDEAGAAVLRKKVPSVVGEISKTDILRTKAVAAAATKYQHCDNSRVMNDYSKMCS